MSFFSSDKKKFKTVNEVETEYNFKIPTFVSTNTGVIVLKIANNEKEITYDMNNVDQCIAIAYCYLHIYSNKSTFCDFITKIYQHSYKKGEDRIYYSSNRDIIYLRAIAYENDRDYNNMINLLKNNHYHSESMLYLSKYYLRIDLGEYYKYLSLYMRLINKSYQEIYETIKGRADGYVYDCLIKGIDNNESFCFERLLKDFDKDVLSLKKAFLSIGNKTGGLFDIYIPLLMERIKKDDPNFFTSLIKSKKDQETIFNNENNFWYGFGVGVITMLIINAFRS